MNPFLAIVVYSPILLLFSVWIGTVVMYYQVDPAADLRCGFIVLLATTVQLITMITYGMKTDRGQLPGAVRVIIAIIALWIDVGIAPPDPFSNMIKMNVAQLLLYGVNIPVYSLNSWYHTPFRYWFLLVPLTIEGIYLIITMSLTYPEMVEGYNYMFGSGYVLLIAELLEGPAAVLLTNRVILIFQFIIVVGTAVKLSWQL